jgi:hypothetical protein
VTSSPRVSSFTKDRHPVTTSRFNAARPTLSICATAGLTLLRAHGIRPAGSRTASWSGDLRGCRSKLGDRKRRVLGHPE